MIITVDPELCMGHGRCNATDADLYPLDELGFSALKERGPVAVPTGLEAKAREGADACPERAISVDE